jgi:hypothetical protein
VITAQAVAYFLKTLAPDELPGLGVAWASELAEVPEFVASAEAVTGPTLHTYLRPLLRSPCAGPLIVLNDRVLRSRLQLQGRPDGFALAAFACGIHEAAHALEFPWAQYAGVLRNGVVEADNHGPTWLRFVCHLHHRATRGGFALRWSDVADWRHYGISDPAGYAASLETEPATFARLRFDVIRKCRLPESFARRWANDQAKRLEFAA